MIMQLTSNKPKKKARLAKRLAYVLCPDDASQSNHKKAASIEAPGQNNTV